MLESDAKTKWCPMSRIGTIHTDGNGNTYALSYNRDDDRGNTHLSTCVGSECMMWRWNFVENASGVQAKGHTFEEHGHCGLAGHPIFR